MVKVQSPCMLHASRVLGLQDSPVCGHHLWELDQHHRMWYHYTGRAGKSGYRNVSLRLNYLEIKQVSSIYVVDKKAWSFLVQTDSTSLCYNIFNWMIKYLIFLPPDCYWLVPQHTYTCCSMAGWSPGQWPLVQQRSSWWTKGRNSLSPEDINSY